MGSHRTKRPTAAGTLTNAARRSAKESVSRSACGSRRAACSDSVGSTAVAMATPKTPSGNSIRRSA